MTMGHTNFALATSGLGIRESPPPKQGISEQAAQASLNYPNKFEFL